MTIRPVGQATARPVYEIAQEIHRLWQPMNYAAKPYAKAMLELSSPRDMYYDDRGDGIIAYFLSNATTWKGPDARRIKAELRAMIKR